ncbi:hypothetical protein GGX14DRAFT_651332 [Mycena pura]|uniref:Uncharacterized protein n=1 Tax=Mycena pura TaxID=153505 RepID=A0AAD7E395_9AGAR|nr:hypothetical protein GGX14DRAFT_651332 [Mycena pura]
MDIMALRATACWSKYDEFLNGLLSPPRGAVQAGAADCAAHPRCARRTPVHLLPPSSAFSSELPVPGAPPVPLPELLVPAALYALTHLLRDRLYALSALVIPAPCRDSPLDIVIHGTVDCRAPRGAGAPPRAAARPGLGWAAVEGAISVAQGYAGLALYRDVLIPQAPPPSPHALPTTSTGRCFLRRTATATARSTHDLEQLLVLRPRDELADALRRRTPLGRVPPSIPCLQRFNALLLSLGPFLLLGAALFAFAVALVTAAAAAHLLLAVLHTPGVLPHVGLHSGSRRQPRRVGVSPSALK